VIKCTYKAPESSIGAPSYLFTPFVARIYVDGVPRAPATFRVDGRATDSVNVSANSAEEAEFDLDVPSSANGVDLLLPSPNGTRCPVKFGTS
jgi:hypothetical protein